MPAPARRVIEPHERLEDALPPRGWDARPVVRDREAGAVAFAPAVDVDACPPLGAYFEAFSSR